MCAVWMACSAVVGATDHYVDVATGANANSGAQAAPWRTLQFAAGNAAVQAGDTVRVVAGDYTGEGIVTITRAGSPGNLITFISETRRSATVRGFDMSGAYVRVEAFDVTNGGSAADGFQYGADGIQIVDNHIHQVGRYSIIGGTDNVIIRDNYMFQVQMGIVINGNNWLVENNEIERVFNYGNLGDADYSRFWGTNGTFRDNYFHGTLNAEIGVAHVDGFQTFAGPGEAHDITWEGNIVQDFSQGIECEGTNSGFRIVNNIWVGGEFSAWGIVFDSGVTANSFIAHNVFADITWFGVGVRDGSSATIQNNIFYDVAGARSIEVDGASSVTLGNNLIFNSPPPVSPDATDIIGLDPLFVNAAARDYHLQAASPAINAGRDLSVTDDIEDAARPFGAAPDIGPYEFGAPPAAPAPEIEVYDGVSPSTTPIFDGVGSVDFGSGPHGGSPLVRTFSVTNSGSGALSILSLSVPSGYAVTDGLPSSIGAGATDTFTLSLDASVQGVFGGTVTIANSDANENPFTFTITGAIMGPNVPAGSQWTFLFAMLAILAGGARMILRR